MEEVENPRVGGLSVVAAAAGLCATGLLAWAVLSSVSGYPRYSPLRHFISQLADPMNPHAGRVNQAFLVGGALMALSMSVPSVLARAARARWAARLAAGAGACLCFVGVFDLTAPVPHFGFAILTGALSVAACVMFARSARDTARGHDEAMIRRGAAVIRSLVWLQLASLLCGVVYAVYVVAKVGPGSLDQLLRLPPRVVWVHMGGTYVNPFAVAEWALFSAVACLVVIACAHPIFRRYSG